MHAAGMPRTGVRHGLAESGGKVMICDIKSRFWGTIGCIMLTGALFLSGCAGGDTATVTIRIGNQMAKADMPSVVDRIIAFLSLSTRVQADPVPSGVYEVSLMVSGAGMASITRNIPESGELTLDVPSGAARTFTVVGYDEGGYRYMGGIATRDLAPGENITIPIQMGALPGRPNLYNAYATGETGTRLEWDANYSLGETLGFRIYRDTLSEGSFGRLVASGNNAFFFDGEIYSFDDTTGHEGLFYRVSAYNAYGESDPSEALEAGGW